MTLTTASLNPRPGIAPLDRVLLDVLSEAGVADEQLAHQIRRQDCQGRRALWSAATDLLGSGVGVQVGARLSEPRWAGPPAFVVRAAATLRDGLARFLEVRSFILGGTRLTVRRQGDQIVLTLNPSGPAWPAAVAEAVVLSTLTAGHRWTGVAFPAMSLRFRHQPSRESVRALASLTDDTQGGRRDNGLAFSHAWLELPFVHADAALAEVLKEMLPRLPPTSALVTTVRAIARKNLTGRAATDVANAMAMSPRTLQRKLATHGVQLRQVIEEVRIGVIQELLTDTRLSLREIADRTGYSDERALARAARVTPTEFRRTQRPGP